MTYAWLEVMASSSSFREPQVTTFPFSKLDLMISKVMSFESAEFDRLKDWTGQPDKSTNAERQLPVLRFQ